MILDRLPYLAKFLLIGVVAAAPLAVVTHLQVARASQRTAFFERERLGIQYIQLARGLLESIQALWILETLEGTEDARARQSAQAREAVARIDELDGRHGGADGLRTHAPWTRIRSMWLSLDGSPPADRVNKYRELSGALNALIGDDVRNYSNLVLDPDLDSYWLMVAFTEDVAETTEALTKATVLAAQRARLDQAQRLAVLADASSVTRSMNELEQRHLAIALREAPSNSRSTTLPSLLPKLRATKEVLLTASVALLARNPDEIPSAQTRDDLGNRSLASLRQAHALWTSLGEELDDMCRVRARAASDDAVVGLAATVVGSLLLVYVFASLYSSVRYAVDALGEAASKMVLGTGGALQIDSKDEVAQIAASFNQIRDALEEARDLRVERERLGRDLHDEILQRLYAIGLGLDALRLESDPAKRQQKIEDSISALNQVMRGIRNVIEEGESGLAHDGDLERSLRRLARDIAEQGVADVALDLAAAALRGLDPEVASQLTIIAGEAMSNTARHARATHGILSLKIDGEHVVLTWRDDGIGFDPHVPRGDGLTNMQSRCKEIGGELDIKSAEGLGTVVVARVPRRPDAS